MSRETTFERDLHAVRDREQLTRIFTDLCVELSDDLQRKRYTSRTIGIKLRFENFKTVTRDNTLACTDRRSRSDSTCRWRMPEACGLDEANSVARRARGQPGAGKLNRDGRPSAAVKPQHRQDHCHQCEQCGKRAKKRADFGFLALH